MNDYDIRVIKSKYTRGARVRLINMSGEPQMYCGLEGTVCAVDDMGQIHVNWDNGSSLALNVDFDSFVIVQINPQGSNE